MGNKERKVRGSEERRRGGERESGEKGDRVRCRWRDLVSGR
jgi:hypothetical protein